MNRKPTKEILAANLRYLMQDRGWDQVDTARRSGVDQKTISNILNLKKVPTLDTVDSIAAAFGLNLWHMILPTLAEDLKNATSIREVYDAFFASSHAGRAHILAVSRREADYNQGKAL